MSADVVLARDETPGELGLATRIGGGLVAAALGIAPHSWEVRTPWGAWARVLGLLPETPDNPDLRRGRHAETYVERVFTHDTGLYVGGRQLKVSRADALWAVANLDGLVFEGREPFGSVPDHLILPELWRPEEVLEWTLGVYEGKTSREWHPWEQIPPYYLAQARHYLWITGLSRCWFAVGFAGWQVEVYLYEPPRSMIEWQAEQITRFYDLFVAPRVAPPVGGGDLALVAATWPKAEPEKTAEIPADLLAEWRRAKAAEDTAVELRKAAEARIRTIAEDAGLLVDAEGRKIGTLREQTRRGAVDEDAVAARLKIAGVLDHPDVEPPTIERLPSSTYRVLRPTKEKSTDA